MRVWMWSLPLVLVGCPGGDDTDTALDTDTAVDTDSTDTSDTVDPFAEPVSCSSYGGQAVVFDGASNLYTSWLYSFPAQPRNYTFEVWLKPDVIPAGEVRVFDGSLGDTTEQDPRLQRSYFVLDLVGGAPQYESRAAAASEAEPVAYGYNPEPALEVGVWQHVAWVLDGGSSSLRVYIDGVLVGESTDGGAWWTTAMEGFHHLHLGGRGSMFLQAEVDDFRIWSVARSQQEIRDNLCTTFDASNAPTGLMEAFTFDVDFKPISGRDVVLAGTPTQVARP